MAAEDRPTTTDSIATTDVYVVIISTGSPRDGFVTNLLVTEETARLVRDRKEEQFGPTHNVYIRTQEWAQKNDLEVSPTVERDIQ